MDYADILDRERPAHRDDPFSYRHPKMARLNRAKLFAPFAALAGYDAAVRSKEVPYTETRVPDADEVVALNRRLNRLSDAVRARRAPAVRVEYFVICDDENHEGRGRLGLYRTAAGRVRRVDAVRQVLVVGSTVIPFGGIRRLSGQGDGE